MPRFFVVPPRDSWHLRRRVIAAGSVYLAALAVTVYASGQHRPLRRPVRTTGHPVGLPSNPYVDFVPITTLPDNPYVELPLTALPSRPASARPGNPDVHGPNSVPIATSPDPSVATAGGVRLFPEIPDNPFAFATAPHLPPPPPLPPGLTPPADAPTAVPTASTAHPVANLTPLLPSMAGRHYGPLSESEIIIALRTLPFGRLSQAGNTSINLHAHLAGPVDGGYKPSEARHVEHYRAEIAAFRVAQLLGIERVPPAVLRIVPASVIPDAQALGIVVDANGNTRGAMIYWVPVLHHIDLESPDMVARWSAWLRVNSEIPPEERPRAEEISTLIVFDYLIGNWDRWHGTNTLVDGQNHLVYRDNNGGFFEPFDAQRRAIVWAWLRRVQCFSRSVIDRVRALTEPLLRAAMATDSEPGNPLLSNRQIASFMGRRDELLMYVDTLVAVYGESAVYTFP